MTSRRRAFRVAGITVSILAAVAVWTVANGVFPYHSLNHDEAVYLQQAAMLLEGQLNLWPPLDDVFRPWFFVEDGDRLYPKYAPVPAAVFAVGKLLGGYRLALAGVAGANVALTIAVVAEIWDRPTGLLAGVLLVSSPLFLIDSSVFLPYAPTAMLNLAFAYSYLRADREDDVRWAAAAGVAIGLAFFSRPYTAVLFAAPFIGHALWTLIPDPRGVLHRHAATAGLGLGGVAITVAYNVHMTGSPWLFPYQAFAPLDGLGFGERRILAHEVVYTPELAVRVNALVLELFFTEWIAGGLFAAALAAVGVAVSLRDPPRDRRGVLAGLFVSIPTGNVFFWGNFNILGVIDRAGDGLVASFGPYYHFDLLLPTAAFAAAGAVWAVRVGRRSLHDRVDPRYARVALAGCVVVAAVGMGTVTADDLDRRIDRNMAATETYGDAYAPFEDGAPANSVILLPDPYGDWLNHPFQPLRNEPGFDGRVIYVIDEAPFAVANQFPERSLYRYGYRGAWAPYAGSPDTARLQRVRDVTGTGVRLDATVGIPAGADGVTVRLWTGGGSAYAVASGAPGELDVGLVIVDGRARLVGDARPVGTDSIEVDGRDDVRMTVFVDYGAAGGFSYRFDLPMAVEPGRVRAVTPRIERCVNVRACGGAAAYIPSAAPDGVFVRSRLSAVEPNP